RPSLVGPLIVAILVVIVIIVVMRMRRPQRASVMGSAAEQGEGLAALMRQDPSFNGSAFAERVARVMKLVNDAWCAGNMGPARRFISDGIYVRFQTQLRLLKAQGKRNAMADWQLLGGEIL